MYDHTLKVQANDTTLVHLFNNYYFNEIGIPTTQSSFLKIFHYRKNNYTSFKDFKEIQQFYSKRILHIVGVQYFFIKQPFTFYFNNLYGLNDQLYDNEIGVLFEYNRVFLNSTLKNQLTSRFGEYVYDTLSFNLQNHYKYSSPMFSLGFKGQKIDFEIHTKKKTPDLKRRYNQNGLSINTGQTGSEFKSKVRYKVGDFSLWSKFYLHMDSTDVPFLWEQKKIGELTAIDDTLSYFVTGIGKNKHQIEIGSGHWKGKIWIGQLFPSPFTSVWPILAGTKYYLDSNSRFDFKSILYSYQKQFSNYESKINCRIINLSGSLFAEQWAILFPFITIINDVGKINIKKIDIIESEIIIEKVFSKNFHLQTWINLLLPINIEIEDGAKDPSIPPDPIIPKEKQGDLDVTGGIRFGLSLKYYLE